MTLLEEFEDLCKYIREVTGGDLVCGLCEYDAGTVGEEPMECPGFDSNECFVLKESLRKQYELYEQVIRCKDCKHLRIVNSQRLAAMCKLHCHKFEPFADDYRECFCSWAERKEE